jgi:hypothetical protein
MKREVKGYKFPTSKTSCYCASYAVIGTFGVTLELPMVAGN